ncbi:hypothetical protein RchiOBHm_Chr7g0225231 [Rosa chinensis]|uniref:Uncharacterized protein n=1 Tax=Rosa chinensis TaxID=74649 RepID=A0A2P6PE14_ROSCH|nr:hypothetical protein RchiOBHm_Chr7g0225231 [Rosa chinensis]
MELRRERWVEGLVGRGGEEGDWVVRKMGPSEILGFKGVRVSLLAKKDGL